MIIDSGCIEKMMDGYGGGELISTVGKEILLKLNCGKSLARLNALLCYGSTIAHELSCVYVILI